MSCSNQPSVVAIRYAVEQATDATVSADTWHAAYAQAKHHHDATKTRADPNQASAATITMFTQLNVDLAQHDAARELLNGVAAGDVRLTVGQAEAMRYLPSYLDAAEAEHGRTRCTGCGRYAAADAAHTCPPTGTDAHPATPALTPTTPDTPPGLTHLRDTWLALAEDPDADPAAAAVAQVAYFTALDSHDPGPAAPPADVPDAHLDNGLLILPTGTGPLHPATGSLAGHTAAARAFDATQTIPLTDHIRAHQISADTLQRLRDLTSGIETGLVARVDAAHLRGIVDTTTGITVTPTGGYRYTGWQHDKTQAAVADALAADQHLDPNLARAVVGWYADRAAADYYRSGDLRRLGLHPADFATGVAEPRRLAVKFPDADAAPVPYGAADYVLTHRDALLSDLAAADEFSQKIPDLPLDRALREFASLRHTQRDLTKIHTAVTSDAAHALASTDDTAVEVDGTTWTVRRIKATERWDKTDLDRVLISRAAQATGAPKHAAGALIDGYRRVAHITRYRVKTLKADGIDPDDYRVVEPVRLTLDAPTPAA